MRVHAHSGVTAKITPLRTKVAGMFVCVSAYTRARMCVQRRGVIAMVTLLHIAVAAQERMVQLVPSGEWSDLAEELNAPDKSGFSLLHYCSMYNLSTLVPLLFARGAQVNCTTLHCKRSPLHLAASGGHLALVQSLVQSGADCGALDVHGLTPAACAFQNHHFETQKWLSECSHDPMPSFPIRSDEHADKTQQLLQDAFSSFSLHEKCALSMSLKGPAEGAPVGMHLQATDECDVSSVITESDKESLHVAMSLMEPSELGLLEEEARVIQTNVKGWIMRRNYKRVRTHAALIIESRWIEHRQAHKAPTSFYGAVEQRFANKLQAASRGMIARRQLRRIKSQTLALLIFQKNMRT